MRSFRQAALLSCAAFLALVGDSRHAAAEATPVQSIKLLPGYKAELLYSVPSASQGSWVALTVDAKGRLIASDQYGKLYRITPPAIGASADQTRVEPLSAKIGMAQGLLYAFDSLYVMVNGEGTGLYRLRDTNGDDQFDEVKLLRAIRGAGEHGPHAIVLSPDKKSLYICGGNHCSIPDPEASRVPRNWQEDILLDRQWDARGHATGILAPGGWICRTDPEGKSFELVSSGYRNAYDIAFNAEGELFTYDSDMEWDVGTPWYRPTRVCHATSGSEFGWRSGTGKWPEHYPDSLPSVVDVGPGSPTGVVFGAGAKFPAKHQKALFICDWSYGVIYAAHLEPHGATYRGTLERFVSAAPLPATDLLIHPKDGALYFTIGGRRTQSGLYRVTYTGDESTAPASPEADDEFASLRKLRRDLESYHGRQDARAVEAAWPHLSHADRFIRFAARIAIEHQPVESWRKKALSESDPQARILAAVALARSGAPTDKKALIEGLSRLDWTKLSDSQRVDLLRAYGLIFIRMGKPDAAERQQVIAHLDSHFPAKSWPLNRELCQLLAYLEAPAVVKRSLALLDAAPTQEEQIHYAFALRKVASDWTLEDRRRYFTWFNRAAAHRGGASFGGFLQNIRKEAVALLDESAKQALAETLEAPAQPVDPAAELAARPFVKKWTVEELLPKVNAASAGSVERGRQIFAAATCYKCHRLAGEGGITGPDLTTLGRRFDAKTLLESILEPNKVISDQYETTSFILADGRSIVGRVVNLNNDTLLVSTDMLDPSNLTTIRRGEIEEMAPSKVSQMPSGLLDTFDEREILDLVAYLRSSADQVAGADASE